jgi:tetratricopeptide (TPR) repeat protein
MWVMLMAVLAAVLVQQPETLSLLGEPLYAPKLPKAERTTAEAELARAHAAYTRKPSGPAEILALHDAHVALGRIGDALVVLTHGIEANLEEAPLYLARGRGYIVIRKFDAAERDFRKAAATLPSARCSVGLAQYLSGQYERARESYADCRDAGVFAYLAERRSGRTSDRPTTVEGRLPSASPPIRLPGTVKRGSDPAPEPIAASYLAAMERLLAGDEDGTRDRLKKIVEKNRNDWMDLAYIAAEADYARLKKPERRKRN